MKHFFLQAVALFAIAASAAWVHAAGAATLNISPATGTFEAGTTFTAGVYVSSQDQVMNAASGVLSFPLDTLQVISLSKNGSVANLWVQEPAYSNFDGTVTFEGVALNQGFQGASGKLLDVRFQVKKTGSATVNFTSGTILANDGKGTNVLTGFSGASYSFSKEMPPPLPPSAPKANAPFVISSPAFSASSVPSAESGEVPRPAVLSFSATTQNPQGPFRIEGKSGADLMIKTYLIGANEFFILETAADRNGDWHADQESALGGGTWRVTAKAFDKDGNESKESDPLTIEVPSTFSLIRSSLGEWGATGLAVILILGLLIVFFYFVLHHVQLTELRFKKELWRFKTALHADLRKLDKDLVGAEKGELTVDLTPGKIEKLRRGLKSEITAIEKDVEEEMKELEKIDRA